MPTRPTFVKNIPTKVLVARAGQLYNPGVGSSSVVRAHEDVYMEKPTSGDGFTVNALRNLSHKSMRDSGMVSAGVQSARFHFLQVNAAAKAGALTVRVRNGGPTGTILRSVSATAGATIDQTASPDLASAGLYFEVVGGPTRGQDVSIYYV